MISNGKKMVFDAYRHGNFSKFINSSCYAHANAYFQAGYDGKEPIVMLFADKYIPAGRELLVAYSAFESILIS